MSEERGCLRLQTYSDFGSPRAAGRRMTLEARNLKPVGVTDHLRDDGPCPMCHCSRYDQCSRSRRCHQVHLSCFASNPDIGPPIVAPQRRYRPFLMGQHGAGAATVDDAHPPAALLLCPRFSAGKPNENAAASRIKVEANRPNQNRLNQTLNRTTAFIMGFLPTVPGDRAFFMFSFARLMVWTNRPTD